MSDRKRTIMAEPKLIPDLFIKHLAWGRIATGIGFLPPVIS
jgi:hypothetical protein